MLSAWIRPVAKVRFEDERNKEEYVAGLLKAIMLTWNRNGVPQSYGILILMEYDNAGIEDLRYLREGIEATKFSLAILAHAWSSDKDVDKLLERMIKG